MLDAKTESLLKQIAFNTSKTAAWTQVLGYLGLLALFVFIVAMLVGA